MSFDEKLRPAARGHLHVELERLARGEAVHDLVANAGPGWICTTGKVLRWQPGEPLPGGNLLAAELVISAAESMHVRASRGAWIVSRLREDTAGDDHAFDDELESTEGPPGAGPVLRYRTWWRRARDFDGVAVWCPFASRFLGWRER